MNTDNLSPQNTRSTNRANIIDINEGQTA